MISPSKKIYYAVEAVLHIAYSAGAEPVSSRDIAAKQNLPPRYLEQIMQKLVRAGILRGVRGPRGGYLLARERRRISVGEICTILFEDDEDERLVSSTALGKQLLSPLWDTIGRDTTERLSQVTLADLCEQASQKGIRKSNDGGADFTI